MYIMCIRDTCFIHLLICQYSFWCVLSRKREKQSIIDPTAIRDHVHIQERIRGMYPINRHLVKLFNQFWFDLQLVSITHSRIITYYAQRIGGMVSRVSDCKFFKTRLLRSRDNHSPPLSLSSIFFSHPARPAFSRVVISPRMVHARAKRERERGACAPLRREAQIPDGTTPCGSRRRSRNISDISSTNLSSPWVKRVKRSAIGFVNGLGLAREIDIGELNLVQGSRDDESFVRSVRESRARDSRSIAPKSGWKERDSILAKTRSRECENRTGINSVQYLSLSSPYVDYTYVIAMHARTRVCLRTGGMA